MKQYFMQAAGGLSLLMLTSFPVAAEPVSINPADIMMHGLMQGDRYAPNTVAGYNLEYGMAKENEGGPKCRRRGLLEKDFGHGRRLTLKYNPLKDPEKIGLELTISLQPRMAQAQSCGRLRSLLPDREEIMEKAIRKNPDFKIRNSL